MVFYFRNHIHKNDQEIIVSMKEKLLELRGKVDIDPDWQSLREMDAVT
jgi:hypothetical protein